MSLATNISSAFTRVGTECKSIRTLVNGNQSTLNALTTTAKSNLVAAINELDAAIDTIIASGSATNLDALTDVTLSGPTTGHVLRHNGSLWVNVLGTTFYEAAGAAAAAQAASQPLDADLTALAALAGQTSYGRNLLTLVDQTALVALLPSYQPLDADLTAIAALAGQTTYGRSFLTMADAAAMRSLINVDPAGAAAAAQAASQPLDSDLTSIAALATTAYGRSLLTPVDATAARALLGVTAADDSDAKASVRWASTMGSDIEANGLTMTNAQVLAVFGGAANATTEFPVNTRVLIKNDGTNKWNGIYVVTANNGSAVTFARASDMDTWAKVPGAHTFVEGSGLGGGSTLFGTGWLAAAASSGIINTTAISWVQITPTAPINDGVKEQVRIAITTNMNLVDPGTNNWSGISLTVGDRMLLAGQTNPAENGIYTFGGPVPRAADMDTASECAGAEVAVREGTNGGTRWTTLFKATDTLGTTPMVWTKIGSAAVRLPVKFTTQVGVGGGYTATGGTSGRGQHSNGSGFNIDGTWGPGDRVLVKDQPIASQNGIFVVTGGGVTMDRATDADADAELVSGTVVYVTGGGAGAVLQGTTWVLTTPDPITVGGASGSALNWASINAPSGTAGGDLTGSYPNPDIAPGVVDLTTIASNLKPSGSAADAAEALRALGFTAKTAMPGVARLDQIAVPTAAVNMNGQKITGVANTPTVGTDAVNKNYADGLLAANDAMVFKGGIDCSANPIYPVADAGHVYRVTVAGKIGGASGPNVEVNDTLTCLVDGTGGGTHGAVGNNWLITQTNIDGAVTGPASAVAGNFPSFSGATGKVVGDSGFSGSNGPIIGSGLTTVLPTERSVTTYAQPIDATLTALAAVATSANKLIYATGSDAFTTTDLSAFGRTLIAAADAAAARAPGVLNVYSQTEIGDPTTDFVATFNAALV